MDDLTSFWKPEACGQTVLPDFHRTKIDGKCQNWKIEFSRQNMEGLKFESNWNTVSFYPKNIQEGKNENLELSSFTFFGLAVIPSVMILD